MRAILRKTTVVCNSINTFLWPYWPLKVVNNWEWDIVTNSVGPFHKFSSKAYIDPKLWLPYKIDVTWRWSWCEIGPLVLRTEEHQLRVLKHICTAPGYLIATFSEINFVLIYDDITLTQDESVLYVWILILELSAANIFAGLNKLINIDYTTTWKYKLIRNYSIARG